jgi:hypothetical protein
MMKKAAIIAVFIILLQSMLGILCVTRNNHNVMNKSTQVSSDALINNLFSKYQKKIKPSGVVNIQFALVIEQIVEMIAKDELMILNSWVSIALNFLVNSTQLSILFFKIIQEWVDPRLIWNPLGIKFNKLKFDFNYF